MNKKVVNLRKEYPVSAPMADQPIAICALPSSDTVNLLVGKGKIERIGFFSREQNRHRFTVYFFL